MEDKNQKAENSNQDTDRTQERSDSAVNDGAVNSVENSQGKGKTNAMPSLRLHSEFPFPAVPASPPKFLPMEQIMEAASGFSKMALAHEIAVNDEFVFQKRVPTQGVEKQVSEVMRQAFWDLLQQQLNEIPPIYDQAMVLLGEIKEALISILLPHHDNLRNQINERLDLDLIRQQAENDALDFRHYADFIITTMGRLCAPVRDEKINELRSLQDIVPLYRGILETLDLMKLDLANFTILQMRPHIQQHSVAYEKETFKELLNTLAAMTPPADGLELTKKWFESVYDKIQTLSTPEKKISVSEVITKAFLEILEWNDDYVFPETLQMDKSRFLAIKDEFTTVVLAASVLLLTYSIVGESIQGITSLKLRLKDQLFVLLKNASSIRCENKMKELLHSIEVQVLKEVNESLVEHGFPVLSEPKVVTLSAQINDVSSPQHSVRKIISTRVLEFMENVLNSSNAASVKIPPGLSAFHHELSSIAGTFHRLVNHNRAVFGDYYTDISTEIMQRKSE